MQLIFIDYKQIRTRKCSWYERSSERV